MYRHLPTSECYADVILWPQPPIFPQTSEMRMEVYVAEHHSILLHWQNNRWWLEKKMFLQFYRHVGIMWSTETWEWSFRDSIQSSSWFSLVHDDLLKQHPQSTWCYWLMLGRFTVLSHRQERDLNKAELHTTEFTPYPSEWKSDVLQCWWKSEQQYLQIFVHKLCQIRGSTSGSSTRPLLLVSEPCPQTLEIAGLQLHSAVFNVQVFAQDFYLTITSSVTCSSKAWRGMRKREVKRMHQAGCLWSWFEKKGNLSDDYDSTSKSAG